MKKIIFAVCLITLSICSYAQDFNFGAIGGINVSNLKVNENSPMYSHIYTKPDVGGFGGIMGELETEDGLLIGTQVLYNSHKYKVEYYNNGDLDFTKNCTNDFLSVPFYVGYKHYFTPYTRLVLNVGGAINYSLKDNFDDKTIASVVASIGVEYDHIRFSVGYNIFTNSGEKINGATIGVALVF